MQQERKSVLLLSDQKKTQEIVQSVKDNPICGFEVSVSGSFENRDDKSYNLILVDLGRSVTKGLEQLKLIRKANNDIPVAIIAKKFDDQASKITFASGAYGFLEEDELKPHTVQRLICTGFGINNIEVRRQVALTVTGQKEGNLRAVIDNAEDSIILVDDKFNILDYNKPSVEFLEFAFDARPQLNDCFIDLIGQKEAKAKWKNIFEHTLKGDKYNFLDIYTDEGEKYYFRINTYPVHESGNIIGISIIASNNTEFVKTQQEKELREANLRSLIQNTFDPMWSIDTNFCLIAFNSAYEDLASQYLGRAPEHGDSVIFESYSDELAEQWEKSYHRALKGERFDEEMIFNYAGGNIYIENEFNPIRDSEGNIIGVTCFSRDNTERRQQEETNKEYASIVEFSNDAIIGFDLDGTIENWNPAATKAFGYRSYDMVGQNISVLYGEKEYNEARKVFRKVLAGEKIDRYETTMVSKDGGEIPVSMSFSLHKDGDGKITKASALIQDISEQVKAERELIEQQHFIESITETSPSILYVYDFYENKAIYINRRASEILGYNKEEIRRFQQGLFEFTHPEDQPKLIERNKELLHSKDGDIIDTSYRVKHKDGHYIWLNVRNTIFKRMPNGRVRQILGTARDITQEKQTAQEIELLSLFAKHTLNYVIISNPERKVEFVNKSFMEKTGYTFDEVNGKVIETVLAGDNTDGTTLSKIVDSKKQLKPVKEEIVYYSNSGEPYWAAVFVNPVFDEFGKLKQFVQIQIDISDRKRNEELTLQAKELAERNARFKDEFLANMSHEIRTPLNGIIGMIDILETTDLDEKQRYYVDTFKKSSRSLLEIINNILDLSKLEAGKMELKPNEFILPKMVENIQRLYMPIANQKDIYLKLELGDNVPEAIKIDENKLFQITSNLLSNSIKFTEKGGVTLRVSTPAKKNVLKFEIIDTGIGITEENQHQLFQKFTQVDQSSGKRFAGTGLGLAISKELVYLFDGDIGVASKQGSGSTFWFTIPYEAATATKKEIKEQQEIYIAPAEKYGLNVLIVEDKFINQEVASLILSRLGCKTEIAENGEEAIEQYQDKKYDLILMDIQMPVMDGVEATEKLRKSFKQLPPIIAVSANAMEGDAEKYLKAGMDDYLAKPVTIESVSRLLRKWFVNKEAKNKQRATAPPTRTEDVPMLKDEILNSLRNMGDEVVLEGLFQSFVKDTNELMEEIIECAGAKNYEQLRKANHTINGLSGTIGASQLNKLCIKLSDTIKEEELDKVPGIVKEMKQKHEALIGHIQETILKKTAEA